MEDDALSVLILAGGSSTRMGQDKAWLLLDGQPLVERVTRRLLPLASEIILSTNTPDRFEALARSLPVPVQIVTDRIPGAGPLGGLQAGLSAARHELTLMVATDMPFLNLALIWHMWKLAGGHDVVVPVLRSRTTQALEREPLHAIYRKSCLPGVEAQLSRGRRRVVSFFPDVRVREVLPDEIEQYDPDLLSFFNVNTPAEWEEARERADR